MRPEAVGTLPRAAWRRAALAWIAAGLSSAAIAAEPPGPGFAVACRFDVDLLCPEIPRESPRAEFETCLEANRDLLTEECRAVLYPEEIPRGPHRDPLAEACADDFARLCGTASDRMAFARCVNSQRERLSEACRDALDALRTGGPPRAAPRGHP